MNPQHDRIQVLRPTGRTETHGSLRICASQRSLAAASEVFLDPKSQIIEKPNCRMNCRVREMQRSLT